MPQSEFLGEFEQVVLLLSALLPPRYRDQQLGDLQEEFTARHNRCTHGAGTGGKRFGR